jgi:hypothetical protein
MEFYEQLGVERTSPLPRIRAAYGQALAKLAKRRRALLERGGDAAQLDLQRAHLDEAWSVLSDPPRRRRYDAMLRWVDGSHPTTEEALWAEVHGDLVHPAAAVAAKLLRVATTLQDIGQLPLAPSAADEPPTLVPHDDDLTASGRPTEAAHLGQAPTQPTEVTEVARPRLAMPPPSVAPPMETPVPAPPAVSMPTPQVATPSPSAVVIPPAPSAPPPPPRAEAPGLPAEVLSSLVDEHGFSGALLTAVRERLGQSLHDVADRTRISVRYLEALEREEVDALPSATFVRGYVREVARSLHLDPDPLVSGYMARLAEA